MDFVIKRKKNHTNDFCKTCSYQLGRIFLQLFCNHFFPQACNYKSFKSHSCDFFPFNYKIPVRICCQMTVTFFFGKKLKFLTSWYYSYCLHCQLMKGLRYQKPLFLKAWFITIDYLCSVILLRLVSSILCSNCCVVILQLWIYNLLNFS